VVQTIHDIVKAHEGELNGNEGRRRGGIYNSITGFT
jgi:hypothetical protein